MKTQLYAVILALAVVSCGAPSDKKAKLEELRKQESELKKEIAKLEEELGKENQGDVNEHSKYVGITKLAVREFSAYIDVQGRVDSDENVSVSSEMPGTITKINVKLGDNVSKGEVLAETDSKAILRGMEELQTNLDLVNNLYEKQKSLWEQKIGTEVQYLQLKTQKEGLEKRMASLQEQLKMAKLVSPISGVVDEINIKLGSAVAPGVPAVRVVNLSNLKVKADLAESYAGKVRKGDKVIVVIPDANDSLVAEVGYAGKVINPLHRTFGIEVNLSSDKEFQPNTVAKIKINNYKSAKPAIVIPVGTIQLDEEEKPFVLVNEKGKAAKRLVVKGKEYNGEVEILSGLSEGDELITTGYETLNEGETITVK